MLGRWCTVGNSRYSALPSGAVLAGEFALEQDIAGLVSLARRRTDGRALAVRVIYPRSADWADDFLALAEAASRVRHETLASVETFGRLAGGACYIGTELVQGQTLDEWADGVGIPPLPQVVDLLRRLCVGLQTAARAGVAHDALNPGNIRVLAHVPAPAPANDTGLRLPVKVLELGVMASCFDEPRDVRALRFMAPEQLAVRNALDERDDASQSLIVDTFRCNAAMNVFSCGSLLYHLATGGPPFAGASESELLAAQSAGRLVPPLRINPQISEALNAVIVRALAYDPRERFDNVAELGDALGKLDNLVSPGQSDSDLLEMVVARDGRRDSHEQRAVMPYNDQEDDLLDGSPTFKAPDILALLRESRDEHETPTMAPPPQLPPMAAGPDPHEGVSGVSPIALLTSAPPQDRYTGSRSVRQRTTPAAPLQPWPDTLGEAAGAIVLVDDEAAPAPVRISVPHTPAAASSRPRLRRRATWPWLLPLAAAACALAFIGVRAVTSPGGSTPMPEHSARIVDEEPRPTPAPSAAQTPNANDDQRERNDEEAEQNEQPSGETLRTGAAARNERYEQNEQGPSSAAQRGTPARARERAHTRAATEPARSNGSGNAGPANTAPSVAPSFEHSAPDAEPSLADAHVEDVVAAASPASSGATPAPASSKVVESPSPAPVPSSGPRPVSPGHPLSATVEVSSYSVRGSLPAAPVRRAAERLRGAYANCYKAAAQAAGHNAFSELIVEVRIDERGRASSPRVHGGQLPRLDACVADAVAKLVCEKAPDTGTVLASWKVTFSP